MKIGDRLRILLKENNMSQKELSKITGLTEASISRYIRGSRVPRGATLTLLAKVLNTSSDYILGLNNHSERDEIEEAKNILARNRKSITPELKFEILSMFIEDKD